MIPVQMNPMATQGLTEMYRQQRAMMEQARDIQQGCGVQAGCGSGLSTSGTLAMDCDLRCLRRSCRRPLRA